MFPSDNATLDDYKLFWNANYARVEKLYSKSDVDRMLLGYDDSSLFMHYPRLIEFAYGIDRSIEYPHILIHDTDEEAVIITYLVGTVLNFFINTGEGPVCSPVM